MLRLGQANGFGKPQFRIYRSFTISVQNGPMTDLLQLAWFWVLVVTLAATPILMLTGQL